MPGSSSSSAWVPVLMFTMGVPAPEVGADAAVAATPLGGGTPTTICSPSVRTRARFKEPVRTPRRGPPAAATASTTRDPAGSVAIPGRRTLPATSTTMRPVAAAEGPPAAGPVPAPAAGPEPGGPVLVVAGGGAGAGGGTAGPPGGGGGAGPAATGGTTVSPRSARSTHHRVSASPPATSSPTAARWPTVIRTLPCRAVGSRSSTHPAAPAAAPTDRCLCRPGASAPAGAGSGGGGAPGPPPPPPRGGPAGGGGGAAR